ncbi:MAG TPA: lipoxygenase family protein [Nostocaceae cyanobacterium]|nr:lipoxygenase family protein [Nostocaceae cyanobacterium]
MTNTKDGAQQLLNILRILKILLKFNLIPTFNRYKYNYKYIDSLAITNICEIPIPTVKFKLPLFPKDELPSEKWLTLLVLVLVKLYYFQTENAVEANLNVSDNSSDLVGNIRKNSEIIDEFLEKNEDDFKDKALKILRDLKKFDENIGKFDQFQSIHKLNQTSQSPSQNFKEYLDKTIDYYIDYVKLSKSSEETFTAKEVSSLTLEDYNNLFNREINRPPISNHFQEDKYFAYMQVAGPNPLMLQQVKTSDQLLSITGEQYQQITAITMGASDSLEIALQEGRLYLADYTLLKDLRHGSFPQAQKYIYAPLALFAVPPANSSSRNLTPVAISCQEVLFTPLEEGTWMSAKNIVQMVDSNYHELISHLSHTHLFIEPFIVATHHLPKKHPVREILIPHFQGTVLINYGAHTFLIAPGGGVDSLLASTIQSEQQLVIKATKEGLFNFSDRALPDMLKSRGVDDVNKLPVYPYRDDGLLIWNAIHNWVKAYFGCYYSSDSQVLNDINLQNWVAELISQDGGRIENFGENGQIRTLDYLVKAVSIIIFTASAQHAAVNFPQGDLMLYAPAFPLARYTSAPTTAQQQDNFINGLPPLDQAKAQINLLYLLGSVYYTELGQYNDSDFQPHPGVQSALDDFHKELQEIEGIIAERNLNVEMRREMPYEYLRPINIPQSINI